MALALLVAASVVLASCGASAGPATPGGVVVGSPAASPERSAAPTPEATAATGPMAAPAPTGVSAARPVEATPTSLAGASPAPAGTGSDAASTPSGPGAATTPPAGADAQVAAGRGVFAQYCAACHGANGEGLIGPRLIGPGNNLAAYRNARAVFDFASTAMPQNAPGSLSQQQYLDVLAFILAENGYRVPQPLSVDNARQVEL